jgi:DNA-binding MarR family transcriptional regulator
MALELLLMYISFLLATTTACIIYYKKIKMAQIEYESSKEIIKNITLDFSYKLQKVSRDIARYFADLEEIKKNSHSLNMELEENKKILSNTVNKMDNISAKLGELDMEISKLKYNFEKIKLGELQGTKSDLDNYVEVEVLKNLSDTEIEVLTIIEEKGEVSVAEIKDRINKTREHTARLLKKLYDKGYIDRISNRMPYRYYIRKELKDRIKNREKVEAST